MRRLKNLQQLSQEQMEEIIQKSKRVEDAEEQYEMWTQRQPDQDLFVEIEWPDDPVLLGRATGIGYRSDKWENPAHVITHDYIHRHKDPLPYIVMQRPSKKEVRKKNRHANQMTSELGQTVAMELYKQPKYKNKKFAVPKEFVFTQLGHALDVEYERDGEIQQIDWKDDDLPMLAADTERNLLIILPLDGGYPVLMWSPVMTVTARGIEN